MWLDETGAVNMDCTIQVHHVVIIVTHEENGRMIILPFLSMLRHISCADYAESYAIVFSHDHAVTCKLNLRS